MFYRRTLAQQCRSLSSIDLFDTTNRALALATLYTDLPVRSRTSLDETVAWLGLLRQPRARLAITGVAGTGKTTLLRRLALACAAVGGEFDDASALLGDWPDPPPIPLLVDLRAEGEQRLLAPTLASHNAVQIRAEVQRALDMGEALLLIDEADQYPEQAAALTTQYANCRVVAVGQCAEALANALPGCVQLTLPTVERDQIGALVATWVAATSGGRTTQPADLADRSARMLGDLQVHAGLFQLAAYPEIVALAVVADSNGLRLPRHRGTIVDRWLQRIAARIAARQPALPEPATQIAWLRALAHDPHTASDPLLRAAWTDAGILSTDPLAPFTAALVRDRLLGQALADTDIASAAQAHQTPETLEPLAQALATLETRTAGASAPLLTLLNAQGDVGMLAAATALTLLDTVAPALEEPAQQTRDRLLALIGTRDQPIAQRVSAGRLLGDLGDPRFSGTHGPLVTVEGGTFILGADVPGNADEGPPHRVDLPTFQIGVFPVTNGEYARFLAANPEHPLPHYWRDPRFNNPSYPVVGVTWHDAMTYASWLTTLLRARGELATGQVVRLPLEGEWEKAATWGPRGRKKHRFPWGDTWDPGRANTAVGRGDWLTTPVGCFAHGVSAYGLHDLIGNVWEWTASEYLSYPGATMSVHQPGSFVLRGLSCVTNAANARATYRGSHLPAAYWRYHLGFRIAIGRPLAMRIDE